MKTPVAVTKIETPVQPTAPKTEGKDTSYYNMVMNWDSTKFENNTQISKWFKLGNLIDGDINGHNPLRPQAGLSVNQIVGNLSLLCTNIIEPMMQWLPGGFAGLNKQWRINSGYRALSNPETKKGSQHNKGMAVDIQIPKYSAKQLSALLNQICGNLNYDQCILEHAKRGNMIIHVSYDPSKKRTTTR